MSKEINFDKWLDDWKDEIVQMQEATKSDLPTSPEMIQPDLSRTTRDFPRAAELLADVEGFLVKRRAQETLDVKSDPKFKDLTSPERKTVVDSRLSNITRTRDILKATVSALHERSFALMNQRKFAEAELRMTPHA
jgi:hypothetical protein